MKTIYALIMILACSYSSLDAQTRQAYDDAQYDIYDDGGSRSPTSPVKVLGGLAIICYLAYRVIKYFASESKDAKEAQDKKDAGNVIGRYIIGFAILIVGTIFLKNENAPNMILGIYVLATGGGTIWWANKV